MLDASASFTTLISSYLVLFGPPPALFTFSFGDQSENPQSPSVFLLESFHPVFQFHVAIDQQCPLTAFAIEHSNFN